MKRVSVWSLALAGLGCLALAGCSSGGGATVTGVITVDGQPVSDAHVEFEPFDRSQALGYESARTDSSGKFEITPHPKKKGLVPGKYAVWVSKWVRKDGKSPPAEEMEMEKASGTLRNVLPFRYSNREDTPPLTAEIKAGKNDLGTLDVKTKK